MYEMLYPKLYIENMEQKRQKIRNQENSLKIY